MKRTMLVVVTAWATLALHGQEAVAGALHGHEGARRSLHYYIESAKRHSPAIVASRNQVAIGQAEIERLRAIHTRSRLELSGDYLIVPIIATDGGQTRFEPFAQSATDYYGYDLGQSSGLLHAMATWTQPLLAHGRYEAARQEAQIAIDKALWHIRMEEHQLERTVTEHYLLCMLDKVQAQSAQKLAGVIARSEDLVGKLVASGLAKRSDLTLLAIERQANEQSLMAARQSYHTHLMDLNLLCGIDDSCDVALAEADLALRVSGGGEASQFVEQYRLDSLQTEASLCSFNTQYKPSLALFVNGGLQAGDLAQWYRHFGLSAGLTFSWTIADGGQRRLKRQQAQWQLATTRSYKAYAELQRSVRLQACVTELRHYDERAAAMRSQLEQYDQVLSDYSREIDAGQVSVLDYITVLRNKIQAERELMLLSTNRQLVIAAYNYWSW